MKKEKRKKEEFTTEKQEEDTEVTEEGETERAFLHTKAKTFESTPKSDSHLFLPYETKNFHISAKKCQSPFFLALWGIAPIIICKIISPCFHLVIDIKIIKIIAILEGASIIIPPGYYIFPYCNIYQSILIVCRERIRA